MSLFLNMSTTESRDVLEDEGTQISSSHTGGEQVPAEGRQRSE